ncbi:MAG: putative rane protein [Labilithrix sp.]|nr:putative rane protein [Labilithrix sp.]
MRLPEWPWSTTSSGASHPGPSYAPASLFLKPIPPPYDPLEWAKKPFAEKAAMVCNAWAMQGYGTPLGVYFVYAFKIAGYVAGWFFFCSFTPGMGHLANVGDWWLAREAFQKAILWSMLFEILGLGCGSGPLTGRYVPPIGGLLYFLRPGTTKLPIFEGAPIIGGPRRTWLDVLAYAATALCAIAALTSARPPTELLVALAVLLPFLGILDKTLFLAARGEHYWTTILVMAIAADFVPGAKGIHAALWFWAGFSKLNHHFPSVVGVMTSNSPVTRFAFLRRLMYRDFPRDLTPSGFASIMGHAGTVLELAVPIILLCGRGGTVTIVGLLLMLALHGFITSNVPMGVPLEWNVMMVYGGFFLFWKHAGVPLTDMTLPVAAVVAFMCVALPILGNLYPSKIPFLLAMRYYAGNWAYSVWLFKGDCHTKLDRLTKTSPWIHDQLGILYDKSQCVGIVGKVMAFRLMHLHGRVLEKAIPRACAGSFEEYEWIDGEIVAGMVLGWNFGEGHLHSEQLLRAVQAQCDFAAGELRCVMVESQPLFGSTLHYRIHDAKTGLLEEGNADVRELRTRHPWGLTA